MSGMPPMGCTPSSNRAWPALAVLLHKPSLSSQASAADSRQRSARSTAGPRTEPQQLPPGRAHHRPLHGVDRAICVGMEVCVCVHMCVCVCILLQSKHLACASQGKVALAVRVIVGPVVAPANWLLSAMPQCISHKDCNSPHDPGQSLHKHNQNSL